MKVRWGDRRIEGKSTKKLLVGIKEAFLGKVTSIDYLFSSNKNIKVISIIFSFFFCFFYLFLTWNYSSGVFKMAYELLQTALIFSWTCNLCIYGKLETCVTFSFVWVISIT